MVRYAVANTPYLAFDLSGFEVYWFIFRYYIYTIQLNILWCVTNKANTPYLAFGLSGFEIYSVNHKS